MRNRLCMDIPRVYQEKTVVILAECKDQFLLTETILKT